jgi:hypothetical protein
MHQFQLGLVAVALTMPYWRVAARGTSCTARMLQRS